MVWFLILFVVEVVFKLGENMASDYPREYDGGCLQMRISMALDDGAVEDENEEDG
ncbi:hypothetical protein HanHA300_Chr08g0279791 [Helianthus annuus]|nr:hypothetical protein HanHA300_Chr08g0279791 [Helianthus annuus]KAJ0553495.1 hypothetical protein HanHA89_Chr08g0297021 [Helianthus annuus]KAJ0722409.1 hypothetical protein HanOQP8_Chr08g0286311 [Helianthus annuus]